MTIEELLLEWKKDSEINKSKLDDESIRNAQLHAKYLEMHAAIKIKYHKQKARIKETELLKRKWLKGVMTKEEMDRRGWSYDPWQGAAKPMKSELDDYISVDQDIIFLMEKFRETEVMLETLENIINNITWRHQNVKNAIDFMKFNAGV